MKKALSIAVLAVFLALPAALPLQAQAVSGPGYSITPSLTTLAHGASGLLSFTLTIPPNTEGWVSIDYIGSSGLSIIGTSVLPMEIPLPQEYSYSFSKPFTMLDSAQQPQIINWMVETVFNGKSNRYSDGIFIFVDHAYGAPVVVPPSCAEQGYTEHTCTVCGASYRDSYTDATGHDWGVWTHDAYTSGATSAHIRVCANDASHTETGPCVFTQAVTAPTCTEAGYTIHTCSICGYSYNDSPVSALGHDWGPWTHDAATSGAASAHTKACARDAGHTETESCVFVPIVTLPTCTEAGYTTFTCDMCGYSYAGSPVAALGHSPGAWEIVTPATGYAEGERVRHCARCGVELDREAIPKLDGRRYNNTACTLGQYYRDADPALAGLWYMYTPVDLNADGIQTFPLIAANLHYIGDAQVVVQNSMAKVSYTLNSRSINVKSEFLAFYPDFDAAAAALTELPEAGLPVGADISIPDTMGDSATGLMFLRLVIDYDIYADGVRYYSPGMFD